jgi:hypothetical protein
MTSYELVTDEVIYQAYYYDVLDLDDNVIDQVAWDVYNKIHQQTGSKVYKRICDQVGQEHTFNHSGA